MIRWEHLRFSFSLEGEPVQFREFDQGRALVCCELFSLPPNPQLLLDDLLRAQHLVLQLDVLDPIFRGATQVQRILRRFDFYHDSALKIEGIWPYRSVRYHPLPLLLNRALNLLDLVYLSARNLVQESILVFGLLLRFSHNL